MRTHTESEPVKVKVGTLIVGKPERGIMVGGVEYPWGYGWSMINNDIFDNNGDFVVTVPKEGGDV
jgi:hypothetical protein